MEESALGIEQMSIGSMAGILNDLNTDNFLNQLPLSQLEQSTQQCRNTILKQHQIQKFRFHLNLPTLQEIDNVIKQKFKLSNQILEQQILVIQQFLTEYHAYENKIISGIEQLQRDNLNLIENAEDQTIEWHNKLTSKFNKFSGLKLFYDNDMKLLYSEDIYVKYQNQPNLTQYSKGSFKSTVAAIKLKLNEIEKATELNQDITLLPQIQENIQKAEDFYQQQNLMNDFIDFLNSYLIFDITQIVKNSLINIDKIHNYLNKLYLRKLMQQQNLKFKGFEAQEAQIIIKVTFQKLKYFRIPKTLEQHQQLDQSFNEINKQLHDIIQRNKLYAEHPRTAQRVLRKLYDYFFKGNRKFIKLKIRYIAIAQKFEDTIDKAELLNSQMLSEIEKLQIKANTLQNFMSGLFDMGEVCLFCYDYTEQINTFLLQISILTHHYGSLIKRIKSETNTTINTRPRIRKIFEPYPEEEKAILTNKFSLIQLSRVEQSQQAIQDQ